MHDAAHLARALFLHDANRVFGRGARVDHERLAAASRGANVRAEAIALPLRVAFDAIVVEARLPDGDHLLAGGHGEELVQGGLAIVAAFVGMHSRGAPEIGLRTGDVPHSGERRERRADRERVGDAVLAHARHHAGEIGTQLREIQVAVGVDEHPAILLSRVHPLPGQRQSRGPRLRPPRGEHLVDRDPALLEGVGAAREIEAPDARRALGRDARAAASEVALEGGAPDAAASSRSGGAAIRRRAPRSPGRSCRGWRDAGAAASPLGNT